MNDYRVKDYALRRQAFVRWCIWSIIFNDCDPALFMTNYLFWRFEHNLEQKLWICWIFGTTYQFPTTWVIWNEMPDFELVDIDRLDNWNTNHYRHLIYQTDTKYNKGHLPNQFQSYKAWIGDNSQRQHFQNLLTKDPVANFQILYSEITNKLYKFGRYTTWLYLQSLKHCAKLPIEPPNLILSDFDGSRSHRNGLCYAVAMDDWVDQKLNVEQITWLEGQAKDILSEIKKKLPDSLKHKADLFALESMLCSFKKLFRRTRGRYLGYYLDRQGEEIKRAEQNCNWFGIDWRPLWEARKETIPEAYHNVLLTSKIQNIRMEHFLEFGSIDRLEFIFPDEARRKTNFERLLEL